MIRFETDYSLVRIETDLFFTTDSHINNLSTNGLTNYYFISLYRIDKM